jgi:hypothetical protein
MAIPTVKVTVRLFEIVGTSLPDAQVAFNLTRADSYPGNFGGIVPAGQSVLLCDADGFGEIDLFPNALGTNNTQYGVQVFDRLGVQVFPEAQGQMALTFLPDQDCLLHSVLYNIPPLSKTDADAAIAAAQAVIVDAQLAVTNATTQADIATQAAADLTTAVDTMNQQVLQVQDLATTMDGQVSAVALQVDLSTQNAQATAQDVIDAQQARSDALAAAAAMVNFAPRRATFDNIADPSPWTVNDVVFNKLIQVFADGIEKPLETFVVSYSTKTVTALPGALVFGTKKVVLLYV